MILNLTQTAVILHRTLRLLHFDSYTLKFVHKDPMFGSCIGLLLSEKGYYLNQYWPTSMSPYGVTGPHFIRESQIFLDSLFVKRIWMISIAIALGDQRNNGLHGCILSHEWCLSALRWKRLLQNKTSKASWSITTKCWYFDVSKHPWLISLSGFLLQMNHSNKVLSNVTAFGSVFWSGSIW